MAIWNWIKGKKQQAQKILPVQVVSLESLEPRLLLSADLIGAQPLVNWGFPLDEQSVVVGLNTASTEGDSLPTMGVDALTIPEEVRAELESLQLSDPSLAGAAPYGANLYDTSEFMIGDVWVTVVLMESNGSIDTSTENWTAAEINSVKTEIQEGLTWWENTFDTVMPVSPKNDLDFHIDFTYANSPVATRYEPINRPQSQEGLWMDDFLNAVGYNSASSYLTDLRRWDHDQRVAHDVDWAYTIFVADSSADADGKFSDGSYFAYAYIGGPVTVMTYKNDGWGINNMGQVLAHETGHIFYALDEYAGSNGTYTSRSGYYNTQNLNAYDGNPSPSTRVRSMMAEATLQNQAYAAHTSSPTSLQMLGWRDSDSDGIMNVLDVPPTLTGSGSYNAGAGQYQFTGTSSVGTLDNLNPRGQGHDITTNVVDRIQYRIDSGSWVNGNTYGGYTQTVSQNVPISSPGTHTVQLRTIFQETGLTSPVWSATFSVAGPEITVLGNGVSIADGDTTPSTTDGTNFGSVAQGGTAISRTFTVRNDGTGTLTLGTVTVPTGFTLTNGLVSSLAAGASDTFTVRLDSATVGTKAGDVSFTNNDGNENPFNFRITGTVTTSGNPEITVLGNGISIADGDSTPSTTDGTSFGSVAQGGTPISRTFTVRNDGTGTLTLGAVNVPTGFTVTNGLVASLAAGASDTFTVRLDTATTGTKAGTLYFACNDASEGPNFSFRITGTVTTSGNPEITVLGNGVSITDGDTTPSTTDGTSFGSVAQGGTPISRTFTVRNDGTGTLTLGTVNVPTGFTVTNGLVASLAPGASDTFTVRLDTATAGTKVGTLYFACNDANEGPNFSFRITGTVI